MPKHNGNDVFTDIGMILLMLGGAAIVWQETSGCTLFGILLLIGGNNITPIIKLVKDGEDGDEG